MKKIQFLHNYSFVLVFLFMVSTIKISAQTKKVNKVDNSKINPTVITKQKPVIKQPLEIKKFIPHFKDIKPVNLVNNNQIINKTNLKPVAKLPERNFTIVGSSVNGTMTARDPYLNNMAYVEFINGTVLSGDNKVNCTCGVGLTYVKLVLRATAGKDYMITTNVSPRGTNSFGLDLFSGGFVHHAGVTTNNQEVKIILTPQSTGQIELWMQCSDPNGAKRPWTFNSLSVQEVN